ncbi:hypothetical protein THRCLA_08059 [Thraustotheca clavata]|uniref:RING-type domain-containing protein n=1 Tax=Thraustotheca clavata TaxID=74557 RepID=A0A1V9ZAD5_9STRA|nr:hypothetical protein THRCLA_08059 [Thraustotheca clavata]
MEIKIDQYIQPTGEPSGEPKEICCICLENLPQAIATESIEIVEDARIVLNCDHAYCKKCMKTYVSTKITNRQVEATQLICPLPECKCPLDATDILKTTTEALFLKYLAFMRSIEAMDRTYAAWENAMNKHKEEKVVAPCPSCSSRIWKNDGCQHMTCTKCRHEWCWICGSQRFCQLQRILAFRIWGPCLPVRVVTQTIGLTLAAGVDVGGYVAVAAVLVAAPISLLYHVPRRLYKCIEVVNGKSDLDVRRILM